MPVGPDTQEAEVEESLEPGFEAAVSRDHATALQTLTQSKTLCQNK